MKPRAFLELVLTAVVVVLLLSGLPFAIREFQETGEVYLFSRRFLEDLVARLSGPGRLRFILQPAVAIFLGVRDGRGDARAGLAPFLYSLVFRAGERRSLVSGAFASVRNLVAMAILVDMGSQFLIFRQVHTGAALVLGPVLIAAPYALSRAFSNRLAKRQS